MAIVKAVNSRASIGHALNYVLRREKTDEKLTSGIDCNPSTAIEEMRITKEMWGKTGGRQYAHYVHSFHPDDRDKMTLEQFHALSVQLCKDRFKGFEVVIATHKDRDHVHSHIVVNSVSFETGIKHHWKKQDLEQMKKDSNEISREHGLTVPVKGKGVSTYKQSKYRAMEKSVDPETGYKSHVLDCYKAVMAAVKKAVSLDNFIEVMKEQNYDVNWSDNRKYVTFTDKNGNKIRNSNLEKTFNVPLGKEDLINEFERHNESGRRADRDSIGRAREQIRSVRTGNDNTGTVTGNIDIAITKSRIAIEADECAVRNRKADEQSRRRERDRAAKQKAAERSARSRSFER